MKMFLSICGILTFLGFCSRPQLLNIAKGKNEKPDGAVILYEYSHKSTRAFPIKYYQITKLEDGTLQLAWSKESNDICLVKLHEDALSKIGETAKEYKLHKLAESYRPRMKVLDGYSWHIKIKYENGSISSRGENARPNKNLSAGIESINNYIDSLIKASTPADSLGIRHHYIFKN